MPQPTKENVRRWMDDRAKTRKPLPSQKELRRQLGIELIEAARNQKRRY